MKSAMKTAGARWAHEKLAAGMNQAEATAIEDLTGAHGDPGDHPLLSQVANRTGRHGLVGAGTGALIGAIGGAVKGPGMGMSRLEGLGKGLAGGALVGGVLGGVQGFGHGLSSGANDMARREGLRGERSIAPEFTAGVTGTLAGGVLGGMAGHSIGNGDTTGTLIGTGLGSLGGMAMGLHNAQTMRDLGQFRAHTKREAPLDDLTHLMAF